MLEELRVSAFAVVDHRVVVVTHRAGQQDLDLAPQRRCDQAVQERIVGRRVGAKQELALRAATGDQVELPRKDLARKHGSGASKFSTRPGRWNLVGLAPFVSDSRPPRPHSGYGSTKRTSRSGLGAADR